MLGEWRERGAGQARASGGHDPTRWTPVGSAGHRRCLGPALRRRERDAVERPAARRTRRLSGRARH